MPMRFLFVFLLLSNAAAASAFVPRSTRITPRTQTVLYERSKKRLRSKPQGFGGALRDLQTTTFVYSGSVRPGKQSPQRVVLDANIVKPDYAETGIPTARSSLLPWLIEVKTPEQITKMKAAGRLARQILDLAGRAVGVGVTTDQIDALVHEEIVKVTCWDVK